MKIKKTNEKYTLRKSVKLMTYKNKLKVIYMNQHKELNFKCSSLTLYLLKKLKQERSISELFSLGQEINPNVSKNEIKSWLKKLVKLNIITNTMSYEYDNSIVDRQVNLYSEILSNPIHFQHNLEKKVVLILGLGGIGSCLTYYLAQSGIKTIIVVDNDKVEKSNLGRQALYFEKDIGKFKVDVIDKRLRELTSEIKVKKYNIKINSENDLNRILSVPDIVINCLDEPSSYYTGKIVTNYYLKRNIPMINGIGYRGRVITTGLTTIPGETICWNCANLKYKSEIEKYRPLFKNKLEQAGVSSPLANFIASIHAQEVVNVLSDELVPNFTNKIGIIDFLTLKISWEKIPDSDRKCKFCMKRNE